MLLVQRRQLHAAPTRRPGRAHVVRVSALWNSNGSNGSKASGRSNGAGLSLFAPFSGLPDDGTMMPVGEEMCDPETSGPCKTAAYTFEVKCKPCYGTGFVRGPANGRRLGSLRTCMCCHGIGFIRRTSLVHPHEHSLEHTANTLGSGAASTAAPGAAAPAPVPLPTGPATSAAPSPAPAFAYSSSIATAALPERERAHTIARPAPGTTDAHHGIKCVNHKHKGRHSHHKQRHSMASGASVASMASMDGHHHGQQPQHQGEHKGPRNNAVPLPGSRPQAAPSAPQQQPAQAR